MPGEPQLKAAQALANALSGDYDPDEYTDEYRSELKRLLDDAVATGQQAVTKAPDSSKEHDAEVDDLIAALRRSVDTATVEPQKDTQQTRAPRKPDADFTLP
jgi:DNA end-binding protein Ku